MSSTKLLMSRTKPAMSSTKFTMSRMKPDPPNRKPKTLL
jgi:hypothetical protein